MIKVKTISLVALLMACAFANAGNYHRRKPPEIAKNPFGGDITFPNGSSVYSLNTLPNGTSYKGSQHIISFYPPNATLVSCTGTVETIYDWVPRKVPDMSTPDPNDQVDDPSDKPPSKVIALEYCVASSETTDWQFDGTSYSGGFYSNNGLGHLVNFFPYYGLLQVQAGGYRAKVISGAATITLECSPSSLGYVGAGGEVAAYVEYSSQIISPTIELAGVTMRSDGYYITTGQQVKAKVVLKASEPAFYQLDSLDQEVTVDSNAWEIKGPIGPFKSFTATASSGYMTELQSSDLTAASLDMFTSMNGNLRVTPTFHINFAQQVAYPSIFRLENSSGTEVSSLPSLQHASPIIKSVKPEAVGSFSGGAVVIYQNGTVFGPLYAPTESESESGTENANGEIWTAAITQLEGMPVTGDMCTVQIGTFRRRLTRSLVPDPPSGTPTGYKITQDGERLLDVQFPYTFPPPNNPLALTDANNILTSWDSPRHGFTPNQLMPASNYTLRWETAEAHDKFEDWIMYRPDPAFPGQNVSWVHLLKFEWEWSGKCGRDSNGNWIIIESAPGDSGEMVITEENDFPTWNGFKAYQDFSTYVPE